jgi:hypothetical protein
MSPPKPNSSYPSQLIRRKNIVSLQKKKNQLARISLDGCGGDQGEEKLEVWFLRFVSIFLGANLCEGSYVCNSRRCVLKHMILRHLKPFKPRDI